MFQGWFNGPGVVILVSIAQVYNDHQVQDSRACLEWNSHRQAQIWVLADTKKSRQIVFSLEPTVGIGNASEPGLLRLAVASKPIAAFWYAVCLEEAGDSLSFKVWDYDKAGGNDLLGECTLDGSQFHKPGGVFETT